MTRLLLFPLLALTLISAFGCARSTEGWSSDGQGQAQIQTQNRNARFVALAIGESVLKCRFRSEGSRLPGLSVQAFVVDRGALFDVQVTAQPPMSNEKPEASTRTESPSFVRHSEVRSWGGYDYLVPDEGKSTLALPEGAKLTLNFPGEFDQIVPELRNSLPAFLYVERPGEPTDRYDGTCLLK